MKDLKPWIVCAAIRTGNHIITGARHFDEIMHQNVFMYRSVTRSEGFIPWEQGFIDQFGNFHNRVDALQIVKENGQPFNAGHNRGSSNELYSEEIY